MSHFIDLDAIKIFESEDLWAFDKPAGLHSVQNPRSQNESLASLLLERFANLATVANKPGDAGLLQRLDLETSGVIVGAKNRTAWLHYFELLHAEQTSKFYTCVVDGIFPKSAKISNYLGSRARRAPTVSLSDTPRERFQPCHTEFSLRSEISRDCSLICARISRGLRHQIRAHAAALGHPLTGDTLYGSCHSLADHSLTLGYGTTRSIILHCERIQFPDGTEVLTRHDPIAKILKCLSSR